MFGFEIVIFSFETVILGYEIDIFGFEIVIVGFKIVMFGFQIVIFEIPYSCLQFEATRLSHNFSASNIVLNACNHLLCVETVSVLVDPHALLLSIDFASNRS
jgi:hypothetical protein